MSSLYLSNNLLIISSFLVLFSKSSFKIIKISFKFKIKETNFLKPLIKFIISIFLLLHSSICSDINISLLYIIKIKNLRIEKIILLILFYLSGLIKYSSDLILFIISFEDKFFSNNS